MILYYNLNKKMYQYTNCIICHKKGKIKCDFCENTSYLCSKEHLFLHNQQYHNINNIQKQNKLEINNDIRKQIMIKMSNQDYSSSISLINSYLNILKQQNEYNANNNSIIIELLYTLAECYLNLSNLEQSKNTLNEIINLTEDINATNSSNLQKIIFRQKANMLLGAISLNLGEYNNSLKAYFSCENDLFKICKEPELNVKLSAVFLNIGLSYIYLGNKNIAEKYLKKALSQTEGILGNDIIHKLNADIFENLGVVYELMNRYKDSLIFYKKSLKLKFNLYGEAHDEVLELQYKISESYLSLKQFEQAEEILGSIVELIMKRKINKANQETIYRYVTYFYTYGVVLIKLNRLNNAKMYFNKVLDTINGFLLPNDPWIININDLIKICDSKRLK